MTEQLLRELTDHITAHLPDERVELLTTFARSYVRRLPAATAAELSAEELFGQVLGVFELVDGRGSDPIAVRALTPSLATDGYATVGSVVETNTADSPFLVDSVTEELDGRGLSVRLLLHPVVGVERDDRGRVIGVVPAKEARQAESVMHFEVDRRLEPPSSTSSPLPCAPCSATCGARWTTSRRCWDGSTCWSTPRAPRPAGSTPRRSTRRSRSSSGSSTRTSCCSATASTRSTAPTTSVRSGSWRARGSGSSATRRRPPSRATRGWRTSSPPCGCASRAASC